MSTSSTSSGTLVDWLADRVARERHDITRAWTGEPYLTRWMLRGSRTETPGGGLPAVMLHRFHRSDADELHDHPWPFVSVILFGGYWERTPAPGWANGVGPTRLRWYGPGRILRRPASWIHSVVLPAGGTALTLVFRGPKERSWGFWCPAGFKPWRDHLAATATTGKGCGQ